MSSNLSPIPIRGDRSTNDEFDDDDNFDGHGDVEEGFDEPSEVEAPARSKRSASKPEPKPKRRIFRWIASLVGLALVAGLGVGGYLLWPTFNERFIQTVENTAADLDSVQDRTDGLDTSLVDLDLRTSELDDRISEVESAQSATNSRLDGIDELIVNQTTRIDDLDELAESLGSDLGATNATAARQLEVTRAAELMSRARLLLFQANYGLAVADLTSAQVTLASLENEPSSDENFAEVVERLDRAIVNLPDFPVAAASDLDIAWQTLLGTESIPVLPFRDSVDNDEEVLDGDEEEIGDPSEEEDVSAEEGTAEDLDVADTVDSDESSQTTNE